MIEENTILIGDSENLKNILKSFENITNYIECIVGDYNNDESFLGVPVFKTIEEAFNVCGVNHVVAITNEKDFDHEKKYICSSFGLEEDHIVLLRTWLLDILKTKKDIVHKPPFVRIDVCTKCQLNCTECYMRLDNGAAHGIGYMSFEQFKKIVDENAYIRKIEISNSGEVFLNPDLYKILEYSYNKNIKIEIMNGTNFNSVSEKVIEALVKFGVEKIKFSIDGASEEIYPIYRRNGDFNRVIDNIKLLNKYKEKYNSKTPYLYWQFILFNFNECDIEKAREMSKELNMIMNFTKDWSRSYFPKDPEKIKELTEVDYYDEDRTNGYCHVCCLQMITEPQINWDGRVFGCCVNAKKSWDTNVFDNSLVECLNNDYYRNAILRFLGDQDALENGDPCSLCWFYKTIVDDHCYLYL